MSWFSREPLAVICVAALGVAACSQSDSPTAPSSSSPTTTASGATIAGVVNGGGPVVSSAFAVTTSGLTVAIEGTGLSSTVDGSGHFQFGGVPPGDARLRFSGGTVNATTVVSNVGDGEQIQIEVALSGETATIVNEVRSASKVQLCHWTAAGKYEPIEVSTSAEGAHRAHGDGMVGEPVPGSLTQVFNASCQPTGPGVAIEKSTNGHDANEAPGPSITVGAPLTWTYVVTNTGTLALTGVSVVDDKGVSVSCGGQTTLAVGASLTCTGTGVAVVGPYANIGTVSATSAGGPVTDSDPSHYLGVLASEAAPGQKVQLCHRTGNGQYHEIEVSIDAEPAHMAHGDGKVGGPVPTQPGNVFLPGCTVG